MTTPSEDGMREKAIKVAHQLVSNCSGDKNNPSGTKRWHSLLCDQFARALESFAREAVADFRKNKWIISEYQKEARKEALEEAAMECQNSESFEGRELAKRIRSLISKDGG